MNTRFGELREDMNRWMGVIDGRFGVVDTRFAELHGRLDGVRTDTNTRFTELRADMNARFAGVDQRLKTLNWSITVWFSILTLLIVLFRFLRF